eukprot:282670-Hanusia_phi.AAC.1
MPSRGSERDVGERKGKRNRLLLNEVVVAVFPGYVDVLVLHRLDRLLVHARSPQEQYNEHLHRQEHKAKEVVRL